MPSSFKKITLPFITMVDNLKLPRSLYNNDAYNVFKEQVEKDLDRIKYANYDGTADDLKQRLGTYNDLDEYYSYTQGAFFSTDLPVFYLSNQLQCNLAIMNEPYEINGFSYKDQDDNMCGLGLILINRHAEDRESSDPQQDVMIAVTRHINKNPNNKIVTLIGHQNLFVDIQETADVSPKHLLLDLSEAINHEKITQLVSRLFSSNGKFSKPAYQQLIDRFKFLILDNRDKKIKELKKLTDIVEISFADVPQIKTYFDAITQRALDDIDFFEDVTYQKTLTDIERLLNKPTLIPTLRADQILALKQLQILLFVIHKADQNDFQQNENLTSFIEDRLRNEPLSTNSLEESKVLFDNLARLKLKIEDYKIALNAIKGIQEIVVAGDFGDQTALLLQTTEAYVASSPRDLTLAEIQNKTAELGKLSSFISNPLEGQLDAPFHRDGLSDIILYTKALKKLTDAIAANPPENNTPSVTSLRDNIITLRDFAQANQETPLPKKIDLLQAAHTAFTFRSAETLEKLQHLSAEIVKEQSPMHGVQCAKLVSVINYENALASFSNGLASLQEQPAFHQTGTALIANIQQIVQTLGEVSEAEYLDLSNFMTQCHLLIVTPNLKIRRETATSLIENGADLAIDVQPFINASLMVDFDKLIVNYEYQVQIFKKEATKSEHADVCVTRATEIAELLQGMHLQDADKTKQKIQLLNFITISLTKPEHAENNEKIKALLSDIDFLAADHPIQAKFANLRDSAMIVCFEKKLNELKHQAQGLRRCSVRDRDRLSDQFSHLITYIEAMPKPISTEKLVLVNQLIGTIYEQFIYQVIGNSQIAHNKHLDRFNFQVNMSRCQLRLLDLQASPEAEKQQLATQTADIIKEIQVIIGEKPEHLLIVDAAILDSLNNMLWHLADDKNPLKLGQVTQIKTFVDYHKKFKTVNAEILALEKKQPDTAICQQARVVLNKIVVLIKHDPIKLVVKDVQQMNDVLDSVLCGLNVPRDEANFGKLNNLSQLVSGKSSPLWKSLGVALLLFTGIVCITAGILGAIPTGGLSLMAGISIGVCSIAAAQTIACGIKMIHHGHKINVAGPLSLFTSTVKQVKEQVEEVAVAPANEQPAPA